LRLDSQELNLDEQAIICAAPSTAAANKSKHLDDMSSDPYGPASGFAAATRRRGFATYLSVGPADGC
jgi:hypothetical protein